MSDTPRIDEFLELNDSDDRMTKVIHLMMFATDFERELTSMTKSRDQWRECATLLYEGEADFSDCPVEESLGVLHKAILKMQKGTTLYETLKQEEEK